MTTHTPSEEEKKEAEALRPILAQALDSLRKQLGDTIRIELRLEMPKTKCWVSFRNFNYHSKGDFSWK